MTKELATLLGLLYTDGCLSPKGRSSWRFYFSNKSERLIAVFGDCMKQCFTLQASRIRLGKTQDGLHRILVDSKEIGDTLTKRFGTFRTLDHGSRQTDAHLPVEELLRSKMTAEFLSAAFSCDGGVNLYVARRKGRNGGTQWLIRGVYLACAHRQLRIEYCRLLDALGITARNVEGDGKIKIETEKDIRAFYEKVGFIDGVRITHTSRFWPSIEKQALLERIIRSYDSPQSVYRLPQFRHRKVMI